MFKTGQQTDLKQGGTFICLLYVYLLKRYTLHIVGVENKNLNWMLGFYMGGKKERVEFFYFFSRKHVKSKKK